MRPWTICKQKKKNANPNQLNSMKYALNALKFHKAFK